MNTYTTDLLSENLTDSVLESRVKKNSFYDKSSVQKKNNRLNPLHMTFLTIFKNSQRTNMP